MLAFYNKHMAFTRITNVAVKGVAACVPKRIEYNKDFKGLSEEQLQKYIETVGVEPVFKQPTTNAIDVNHHRHCEQ